MADQKASGKVFAYGMGAGGRSHLGAGATLARTAQVPEVARIWPSYEMIHDTVTVH